MTPEVAPSPLSVSAIVVNWNGAAVLKDCLTSLEGDPGIAELLVVDNGSRDDSSLVASRFPTRWIGLHTNTGLASAFNTGASTACGEVLLFLNNDLAIPRGFAETISESLVDKDLGVLDVTHCGWDDAHTTHCRTSFHPGSLSLLNDRCFIESATESRVACAFASGACFAIRADTFRRVGGWDAGFFAGWEDVDLSWRLRLAGLRVEYEPSLTIRHHVSASSHSVEGQRARTYAAMTGRPRFALKHAPVEVAVLSVLRLLAGIANDLRSPSRLRLRGRAIVVTARDLPGLVRWRRRSYREARTTPRELWLRVARETA